MTGSPAATTRPPRHVALDLGPLAASPTGVGAFCRGLLGALRRREDVTVSGYAVALRSGAVRSLVEADLALHTWPLPARLVNLLWQHGAVPSGELVARGWTGPPVDAVHGTNFVVPPCRRAAEIVTVHDLTAVHHRELCAPASLAYPSLVRRAIGRGAFVHTHSRWVAAEVVALLDAPVDRVRAVPPGIEPRRSLGQLGSPPLRWPYLLALGTVEPRKGYPTLVEAFGSFAREVPDVRLVIAGSDGWGSAALEAALRSCPVRRRIVRRGYIADDERDRMLAYAIALVYPSIYEGFGLPPLEAMAAGVPVVASDGGALPEVLGKAALLVPVGDAAALAAALVRVVEDDGLRVGLVERGLAHADAFGWDAAAAGMTALYNDAVEARG